MEPLVLPWIGILWIVGTAQLGTSPYVCVAAIGDESPAQRGAVAVGDCLVSESGVEPPSLKAIDEAVLKAWRGNSTVRLTFRTRDGRIVSRDLAPSPRPDAPLGALCRAKRREATATVLVGWQSLGEVFVSEVGSTRKLLSRLRVSRSQLERISVPIDRCKTDSGVAELDLGKPEVLDATLPDGSLVYLRASHGE